MSTDRRNEVVGLLQKIQRHVLTNPVIPVGSFSPGNEVMMLEASSHFCSFVG